MNRRTCFDCASRIWSPVNSAKRPSRSYIAALITDRSMTWCPATRASHSGWTGDTAAAAIGSPLPKVKLGKQHPPKKWNIIIGRGACLKRTRANLPSSFVRIFLLSRQWAQFWFIPYLHFNFQLSNGFEERAPTKGRWSVLGECVCADLEKCEPLLGATGLKMHIGVRRNLCVFFCFASCVELVPQVGVAWVWLQ